MLWFEKLMGFQEESPDQVRRNIQLDGPWMKSLKNGQSYRQGVLEIPTLKELRNSTQKSGNGKLTLREVIGDVQLFHLMEDNKGALFQAASQFNLLEMVNPRVLPEDGVGIYGYDKTQGPACAIACGAGTIYRNYFVQIGASIGQTAENQIDCLAKLGHYFDNEQLQLWKMENGYALPNEEGLKYIGEKIRSLNTEEYENLKGLLSVGIQWDTEVTIHSKEQIVSQIYCSGLPVRYTNIDPDLWKEFSTLILSATYEATLHAAIINSKKTGNNKVYLTLVGGGVFGNKPAWIKEAILNSLFKFSKESLDIRFISYGATNPLVKEIIASYEEGCLKS